MAVFGLCFGNACATVAAYTVNTLDWLPKMLGCAHPLKLSVRCNPAGEEERDTGEWVWRADHAHIGHLLGK